MKRIGILGSTGSIGSQALQVIGQFTQHFRVVALSAASNMNLLADQVEEFKPLYVVVGSDEKRKELYSILANKSIEPVPEIPIEQEGLVSVVQLKDIDTIIIGLVGFIGLIPSLKALESGKQLLTANKETFVTAGHLVKPYLSQIIPIDSEHSAIFQCLKASINKSKEVLKIYLTASGGPFRDWPISRLRNAKVEEALNHPNWSMGSRVTIDSATMMNKGLEIIEAHHLFEIPLDGIEVVVHPQSIIHSAVAFVDGSIIAQMGQPDMRVPLQYALTYPERWPCRFKEIHLDLANLGTLTFNPADPERFPCLKLARWAAELGGTMPVVMNAADEMAVQSFLNGKLSFTEIPIMIEKIMKSHLSELKDMPNLNMLIETDLWTRKVFEDLTGALSQTYG